MQARFESFLAQRIGISKKEHKILLGVSGGMDSMAMLHLFRKSFMNIAIVHCNFQLRASESDQDEEFVRSQAEQYNIPVFIRKFDTLVFKEHTNQSVQMAARELRYAWFEELGAEKGYDYVAVAHHQDDAVETFFINLLRGTGLTGLGGIKPKSGHVIRPMLCFNRQEIEAYIREHRFQYRNDSSNLSRKYLRNALRLDVIPRLTELKPSLRETLLNEMIRFDEIDQVFTRAVEKIMQELVTVDSKTGIIHIPKSKLIELQPLRPYFYEFLKNFGFNASDVEDIIMGIQLSTNAVYLSKTHRLIREADELLLTAIVPDGFSEKYSIDKPQGMMHTPVSFHWATANAKEVEITGGQHIACLDFDQLKFPLELRKWQKGDYFYPLGMKNRKKLSDFFTDRKFSAIRKENTWVLISEGNIAWIVGARIDERFKVSATTEEVLILTLQNQ